MLSEIFIRRPKLAFVVSLLITLMGGIVLFKLPIAEYPEIVPPTIVVNAVYPGATSQILSETVASIVEEQVNGIEDMIYFKSESDNNGNYSLTLTFASGVNSDIARVNVQNAVQRAEALLPETVRQLGITVTKRSTDIVGVYVFKTDGSHLSQLDLSNYVRMNVRDPFSRLPGVGAAEILGVHNYSMRVWLDPLKISALGLTPDMVASKISSQNVQAAAGSLGGENSSDFLQLKIDARGRLSTEEEFKKIVVYTSPEGEQVLLEDIARLELGSENYAGNGYFNGTSSVALAIYRQEGANAIQLINDANVLLDDLKKRFPDGVEAFIGYDPTDYIRKNIMEIGETLLMTLGLVILITYLFLQNWRATLIPALAIPVSLIGTFFFMYVLGFSINVLTMFGLVLVIGSLVDDAIVVVENTMRIIEEEGLSAVDASLKSMRQITGPVIATTLISVAIYLPIGFYGGMVGTIYLQFAVTMSVALCLSTVNALTLSPALCSVLLSGDHLNRRKNIFFRAFDSLIDGTRRQYVSVTKMLIRRLAFMGILVLCVLAANFFVAGKLHTGFLSDEDKGALLCEIELPPGSALYRTEEALRDFYDRVSKIPGVDDIITVSGFSLMSGNGENLGFAIVKLKDWSLRKTRDLSITEIRNRIMAVGVESPRAVIRAFQPPAIMGLGVTGGVTFALRSTGRDTPVQFEQNLFKLLGALNNKAEMPEVMYAFSGFNARTPQLYLDIDRQKAEAMGVPIHRVFGMLQSNLASVYVNDFNISGYSFKVKIQVDARDRATIDNIESLQIQNDDGEMVPLMALATIKNAMGARKIERFNQNLSASVTAVLPPGIPTSLVMGKIGNYISQNLSKDYALSWTDLSYQERGNEGKIAFLLSLSLIFGYLFLVGQYESWTIPIPVMLSVSFATLGGLLALYYSKMSLDIYAQLGLIMLIGLSAKSAILMVEFSMQNRAHGRSIALSAINGQIYRYRAVLMTAWSFIIGVCPLVFASGAGAESRKIIGTTTLWGMVAATVVGIVFIPAIYALFQKWREMRKPSASGKPEETPLHD